MAPTCTHPATCAPNVMSLLIPWDKSTRLCKTASLPCLSYYSTQLNLMQVP